jgi:hypothetical protein
MKYVLLLVYLLLPNLTQTVENGSFSHRITQRMPKLLYAIGEVESKNGKNIDHKPTKNNGTAIGRWGLMHGAVVDAIRNNPKTFSKEIKLSYKELSQKILKDPTLEEKIATIHFKHLWRVFKGDINLVSFAWLKGETATKTALFKGENIAEHWYVQKIHTAIVTTSFLNPCYPKGKCRVACKGL